MGGSPSIIAVKQSHTAMLMCQAIRKKQFLLKTNLISTHITNNSIGPTRCRFAKFVEALGPISAAEMVKTFLLSA
jgi:hypothetical protein